MALISQLSLDDLKTDDDLWPTDTSVDQEQAEASYAMCFDAFRPGSELAAEAIRAEEESRCDGFNSDSAGVSDPPVTSPSAEGSAEQEADCRQNEKSATPSAEAVVCGATAQPTASINDLELYRSNHIDFLRSRLFGVVDFSEAVGTSRMQTCFDIVNALRLLDAELNTQEQSQTTSFIALCRSERGGYGECPGRDCDVVSTHAAISTLSCVGGDKGLDSVDRGAVRQFLVDLVCEDGGVCCYPGGECTVQAAYCATAIGHFLCIDLLPEYKMVSSWLSRCQSYEGGFGRVPGVEATTADSYYALAALCLMKRVTVADLEPLAQFACRRQMRLEGSFQAHTNGLADAACTLFGSALFPLLRRGLILASQEQADEDSDAEEEDEEEKVSELPPDTMESLLCCSSSLQSSLLAFSQCASGGFVAKPDEHASVAATGMCLRGLSIMQHYLGQTATSESGEDESEPVQPEATMHVIGQSENLLRCVDPLLGVLAEDAASAVAYFSSSK